MVMFGTTKSLAFRLRACLLAVASTLILSAVLGSQLLGRVSEGYRQLSGTVLPLSSAVEALSIDVSRLVTAIAALDSIASAGRAEAARLDIGQHVGGILASAEAIEQGGMPQDQGDGLREAAGAIGAVAAEALGVLERKIGLERRRDDSLRDLDRLLTAMLAHAEQIGARRELDFGNHGRASHGGLRSGIDLVLRLHNAGDAVGWLSARGDLGEIDGIGATLAGRLNAIAALISRLPPGEERESMARLAADFRAKALGPDGLVATQKALAAATRETEAYRASLRAEAERISLLSEQAVGNAVREFDTVLAGVKDATQQIQANDLFFRLSVSLLILGLIGLVLERHVIRRIAALAGNVRAIAFGDLDRKPAISGDDEIGEMERALETFRENALELRRSNRDLQHFAYAASHDLRSPLRAIGELVEWTIEDEAEGMSGRARRNLELVQHRARRLSAMLKDLLDYARAGSEKNDAGVLDLPALAVSFEEMLGCRPRFSVEATGVPQVSTCVVPVRTILLNLVQNAIKHHDLGKGRITISVSGAARGLDITVCDDGPGIEPEYHARIFDPFQTLKPRDAVDGSGLGLAMSRKLAIQLGGDISVTSDPSRRRGTAFTLSLPGSVAGALPAA